MPSAAWGPKNTKDYFSFSGWLCALAVFFCLISSNLLATTFVNRSMGEVVDEAKHIVRGIPGESYTDWTSGTTKRINTYTPFTITLKYWLHSLCYTLYP